MSQQPSVVEGFVEVGSARLHFREEGAVSSPALVLVNPLGSSLGIWDLIAARLRGQFRLLRYDQRGHGGSSVPEGPYRLEDLAQDLIGLLDARGIEKASICGESIGGLVAMWLAIHRPERVERLVVVGTAPAFPPPSMWEERAATVRAEGMAPLVAPALLRWLPAGFAEREPGLTAMVATMLGTCSPEGYAACCAVLASADIRADLGKITAPTLVVCGLEDPVCTPAVALDLSTSIADASLSVLSGTSHAVHLGQPARFADQVLAHLAGPPSERGDAVRRATLGDDCVDRSLAGAAGTALGESLQDLITRLAWGEVWSRPGLDRRTRSAVTVGILAALGRVDELEIHIPGGVRNGLSVEEMGEVLVHAAIYAGFPAARTAVAVARRVLDLDGGEGLTPHAGEGAPTAST